MQRLARPISPVTERPLPAVLLNSVTEVRGLTLRTRQPLEFHQSIPGYSPTPVRDASKLARRLGIERLLIKDESQRLGLPAFKILGASWAVFGALKSRYPARLGASRTLHDMAGRLQGESEVTLVTATDGNHGRALAHVASLLKLPAIVYVPKHTSKARIAAIELEGASVVVCAGGYDAAVAEATDSADARRIVVSDTSWNNYEELPRLISEGYSTMFWEIEDWIEDTRSKPPDLVVVQIGVGALAMAVINHFRQAPWAPRILGVQPTRAASAIESLRAGRIVSLPGIQDSIMVGLNCGTPSRVAWPLMSTGIDAFATVKDATAMDAVKSLAADGITSGETGAAGVAGLIEVLCGSRSDELRAALRITGESCVLAISTEGVTDPMTHQSAMESR
jgi:diaminopropionate ammonia-lyase